MEREIDTLKLRYKKERSNSLTFLEEISKRKRGRGNYFDIFSKSRKTTRTPEKEKKRLETQEIEIDETEMEAIMKKLEEMAREIRKDRSTELENVKEEIRKGNEEIREELRRREEDWQKEKNELKQQINDMEQNFQILLKNGEKAYLFTVGLHISVLRKNYNDFTAFQNAQTVVFQQNIVNFD